MNLLPVAPTRVSAPPEGPSVSLLAWPKTRVRFSGRTNSSGGRRRRSPRPGVPRTPRVWLQQCSSISVWSLACNWVKKASGRNLLAALPLRCPDCASKEEQPGSDLLAQRGAALRPPATAQPARASLPFIHPSSSPDGMLPSLAWHCDTAKISCQSQRLPEWRAG